MEDNDFNICTVLLKIIIRSAFCQAENPSLVESNTMWYLCKCYVIKLCKGYAKALCFFYAKAIFWHIKDYVFANHLEPMKKLCSFFECMHNVCYVIWHDA